MYLTYGLMGLTMMYHYRYRLYLDPVYSQTKLGKSLMYMSYHQKANYEQTFLKTQSKLCR